jgi:hypothetical protein
MRKIKIVSVVPTSGVPGYITVASDFTSIFNGRFYRDSAGNTLPAYTTPAPANYTLIVATTFDIIENTKYAGRYTVYTPVNNADLPSNSFNGTITQINVNEVIPELGASDAASLASDGYLTNISTYLIGIGNSNVVVPPGVVIEDYPITFFGRNTTGWGEGYAQNQTDTVRNFSGASAPTNPFIGQTWFNPTSDDLSVWNGSSWVVPSLSTIGTTYRFTQSSPATTWTVNHMLNLPAPYIGFCQFFVDRGAGPKLIMPLDVTFNSSNQLTVSFTNPEIGYVLVRS